MNNQQFAGTAKYSLTTIATLALALSAQAQLVQTDSSYMAFDATSFNVKVAGWTSIADTTTTPSLAGNVMVWNDTAGIDASSSNNSGTNADILNYSLDFTTANDYYLYVRVQGEFLAANNNDSLFVPTDFNTGPTDTANSLGDGLASLASAYSWILLNSNDDALKDVTVGGSSAGSINLFNIDATEAIGGNTVSFSVAGREQDLQIDRFAFHTNAALTNDQLNALVVSVPEPSAATLFGLACLGLYARRRRVFSLS